MTSLVFWILFAGVFGAILAVSHGLLSLGEIEVRRHRAGVAAQTATSALRTFGAARAGRGTAPGRSRYERAA